MLEVQNLTFSFYDTPLWKPVSFNCNSGELIHLKGQNGAGKSTLLKVLSGLLPGFQGQISWHESIQKGYLQSETNGLFLDLDYLENLTGKTKNEALVKWLGPKHMVWKGFPVRFFSTGMRRRLGLLRTLSSNANCILLDEPLMGLDQDGIDTISKQLQEGLNRGQSYIVVSHQTEWLKPIATRFVGLERP